MNKNITNLIVKLSLLTNNSKLINTVYNQFFLKDSLNKTNLKPNNLKDYSDYIKQEKISDDLWLKNNQVIDVYIESYDGYKIHGKLINCHENCNNYVLMVHGAFSNLSYMYKFARKIENCNFLLIDQRCYGESEGILKSYGFKESLDILQWIELLVEKNENCNICLFGTSMGASSVLHTLSFILPKNVKCAIEDSGYFDITQAFKNRLKTLFSSNNVDLIVQKIKKLYHKRTGINIDEVNILESVKNTKLPILFIHGIDDQVVSKEHCEILYSACTTNKELLLVENCDHVEGLMHAEYFVKINNFIKNYL